VKLVSVLKDLDMPNIVYTRIRICQKGTSGARVRNSERIHRDKLRGMHTATAAPGRKDIVSAAIAS
jgi:hypothetical protein